MCGMDVKIILPTKLVVTAASLDRKNPDRSSTAKLLATNPANFVEIGPVDVEIIGLREITEIIFLKTTAKHI